MEQSVFYSRLDEIFKNGNIKEAEKFAADALTQAEKDSDLPAILAITSELGGIYRVTGRLAEARRACAAAIEAIKILGLEGTEQHGTTLLNLASVCAEAGETAEALELYGQVAALFERAGLGTDYRMAALFNNVSHVHDLMGNQGEAEGYARKALGVIRALPGHDIELATTYTSLAARQIKGRKHDQAMENLEAARKIFLSQPGKPNPHYAATLNALGEVLCTRGRNDEAIRHFEEALELIKGNYGENRSYAQVAQNLAKARGQAAGGKRRAGLELSEAYYEAVGRTMIDRDFADFRKHMAIGLVGEGSECFGFDDRFSESHDFGPGFCIWLPAGIHDRIGAALQRAYDGLPKEFEGKRRETTLEGEGRVGVFSIGDFYRKYTGCPGIPETNVAWLLAPETNLATVTNGKVFEDACGEFSAIRKGLLDFYPEDIRLKKIAARMAMMSQSGQYNYLRCIKRREYAAAYLSCAEFVRNAISIIYLLNRRYMPFYKWAFRGMDGLPRLGNVKTMLERLTALPDNGDEAEAKVRLIEEICIKIRDELIGQGIISGSDAFLNSHARQVMEKITDPQIRRLPVMFDGK